jgi:hypothetical protein
MSEEATPATSEKEKGAIEVDSLGALLVRLISCVKMSRQLNIDATELNDIARLGPKTAREVLKLSHGHNCTCFLCMYDEGN